MVPASKNFIYIDNCLKLQALSADHYVQFYDVCTQNFLRNSKIKVESLPGFYPGVLYDVWSRLAPYYPLCQ